MEQNINFRFNPRHYEDHLSVFGKKVLNVLIQKWKSDEDRARNANEQHSNSLIQRRRVLNFRDGSSFTPPPPIIYKENEFHGEKPFDFNIIERSLPQVPTTSQLVQAVGTSNKTTINNDTNISSQDIITPALIDSIVNDVYDKISEKDITYPDPPVNSDQVDTNISSNVDWDNMFDTELLSEATITNAERVLKQIETHSQNTVNIQFPREMSKKTHTTMTKEVKYKLIQDNKTKRKNQSIKDTIPKKVKKVSEKSKISYRKQNYTKAVKNWLNDVDLNNPVENDQISNIDSEKAKAIDQADIVVEKVVEKSNKKVIQAQLVNKHGIMKFGKPKAENAIKKLECDNTDESVKTTDENVVKKNKVPKENKAEKDNNKENKNKQKFVAPIKSQIPVKDIEFKVTTVDESNIKDHMETLRCVKDKELVIVLIYRNGFSQLNNHYTDDTCDPEGFISSIDDDYFYFKGDYQKNKNVFWSLLESNKIVCYEGKTLLIYFKDKFDFNIHNTDMMDAKIAGCLLDPDNPPENFSDLQKLLSFTPQYTIATECALQRAAWYLTLLKESASKLMCLLMEEQLWNVFVKIEMKLLPIIAEMEIRGVTVDLQKLKSMEEILMTKMKSRELECHKAAGKTFQINSPVQVRALIYNELKLDAKCNVKIRETISKGAKSTSESMLRSLVSVHVLPKLILEYRHLHKAHATFLTGIAQHVKDGIVRPTWVQTAAATGRIASNNPNLQAIPKAPFNLVLFPELPEEIETGKQVLSIRSVYTARAGYTLLAADFKHVECRVFAHAAADTGLLATLRDRQDLFRALAHKWLKKPVSEVTDEDRERTKRIVYASLYGAGVRKLMDIIDVSYDQALSVIASFNRTFPSLKSFGRSVVSRCEQSGGRLATLCGRVRRFQNIASNDFALKAQAERQAVNFVVQGSAADLCKMAMVLTSQQLRTHSPPVDGYLLLQIHDELVWEIRDQHLGTAAVIIKQAMEGCGHQSGMATTLPVSISIGKNWGEMTEYLTDLQ